MPPQNLLENALAVLLDHVAVTRDDLVEVPAIDPLHALVEASPVAGASSVPDEALLAFGGTLGAVEGSEELGEESSSGRNAGLAELFSSRKVEDQISLD